MGSHRIECPRKPKLQNKLSPLPSKGQYANIAETVLNSTLCPYQASLFDHHNVRKMSL